MFQRRHGKKAYCFSYYKSFTANTADFGRCDFDDDGISDDGDGDGEEVRGRRTGRRSCPNLHGKTHIGRPTHSEEIAVSCTFACVLPRLSSLCVFLNVSYYVLYSFASCTSYSTVRQLFLSSHICLYRSRARLHGSRSLFWSSTASPRVCGAVCVRVCKREAGSIYSRERTYTHAYMRVRRHKYIHTYLSTRSSLGTCTVLRQKRKMRRRRTTVPAPYLHRTCTEHDLHRTSTLHAPYLHCTSTVPTPYLPLGGGRGGGRRGGGGGEEREEDERRTRRRRRRRAEPFQFWFRFRFR